MKKFGKTLLVAALMGSMIVTPVYATPTVDELQKSKEAAESAVSSKQNELRDLLIKIDELEAKLIETGQGIIQATGELEEAEATEKKQYEEMKLRIRYMYEDGNHMAAEKILQSKSIAEVLNQTEYAKSLHTYDRNQLQEYVKTKEAIAELKQTLETEKSDLESMQATYHTEKESLNNTIATKQAEVEGFDQQIQEAAAAAAAERQRQIEEQQRQEEAARQQSTADSSQSNNTQNNTTNDTSNNTNRPAAGNSNSDSNASEDTNSGGASTGDTSRGQAVVNAARAYLGVPYVWGGESGSGVDCSGLVLLAHRAIGVRLSHSSGSQGGGGRAVSGMANALPGDIVCYSGHVGIYIGGGQMIHAPQPGDVVKVASVYGSPWFRRYW